MKLSDVLMKGHINLSNQHDEKEKGLAPTYRAGSSGVLTPEGTVHGNCHRLTMLRYQGVQAPVEPETHLMFGMGRANEDLVIEALEAAEVSCRKGEDAEGKLEFEGGIVVTGTPDIMLLDDDGKVKEILELKNMSSIYTARSVTGDGKPKSAHLIQAATYSLMFKVPVKILYVNRMAWHILYNKYISASMVDHPTVTHQEKKDGTRIPFKINPHYTVYECRWNGDTGELEYSKEGLDDWVPTAVSEESIKAYYTAVNAMTNAKHLGPRPSDLSVDGNKEYKACDYCALKDVCNEYEDDYQRWNDEARAEVRRLRAEYNYD